MSLYVIKNKTVCKCKFDVLIMTYIYTYFDENHDWLLTKLKFICLFIYRLQPTENVPFPSVYSTS